MTMSTTIWNSLPLAFLVKATALLLIARLAATGLSRAAAGARYLVWLAMLAMVLVLPALLRYAPARLAILPRELAVTMPSTASRVEPPTAMAPLPSPPVVAPPSMSEIGAPPVPRSALLPAVPRVSAWRRVAAAGIWIWAAVALSLIGWLGYGALAVRRIVRGARALSDAPWSAALCEVADRMGLETTPRLMASTEVEMPFACGVLSPVIVLPATAESWSEERRRAVLFHELAHVRRRDLVGHALGRIVCALYWFHPLVWSAARQMRAESERACDDLVLACGAKASEYADQLLDIVVGVRKHGAPAVALPMARRKEFEGRLIAILDARIPRHDIGRARSAALVLTMLALSFAIVAMVPAPEALAAPRTAARDSAGAQVKQTVQIPERVRSAEVRLNSKPADSPRRVAILPRLDTTRRVQLFESSTSFVQTKSIEKNKIVVSSTGERRPAATDPDRVAMLLRVLRSDSSANVRRAAAWALAEMHLGNEVTSALAASLARDGDANVREMAAWGVAINQASDAVASLATALRRDGDAQVRETAAWGLGSRGDESNNEALIAALRDSSARVRAAAAWAIGQSSPDHAPKSLLALLDDRAGDVREKAAWTLSQIHDPETAIAIAAALDRETNRQTRLLELRALMSMDAVPPALIDKLLASDDSQVRQRAVQILSGHPPSWPWPWPWPRPRPNP